jgi:hypothetical protein
MGSGVCTAIDHPISGGDHVEKEGFSFFGRKRSYPPDDA